MSLEFLSFTPFRGQFRRLDIAEYGKCGRTAIRRSIMRIHMFILTLYICLRRAPNDSKLGSKTSDFVRFLANTSEQKTPSLSPFTPLQQDQSLQKQDMAENIPLPELKGEKLRFI